MAVKVKLCQEIEDQIQATIWIEVACHHATLYLLNGIREYSRWFRGANNNIVKALSQENDWIVNKLAGIFHLHCPTQLQQPFKIVPLPNDIVSCLTILLLLLPVRQQLVESHLITKLEHGTVTLSTFLQSNVPNTNDWNHVKFFCGYVQRTLFLTTWYSSGGRHSYKHCGCGLQGNGHNNSKQDLTQCCTIFMADCARSTIQRKYSRQLWPFASSTKLRQAMGKLAGTTHFWAMQLCKYAKVPKAE